MVKVSQVADGIALFAEKELLPALSGWQMWAASAALVLVYQKSEAMLAVLLDNPVVGALGLANEKGMVDIDAAAEAAKETVRKRGKLEVDIPVFGKFKLDENDFEKLREYINASEA